VTYCASKGAKNRAIGVSLDLAVYFFRLSLLMQIRLGCEWLEWKECVFGNLCTSRLSSHIGKACRDDSFLFVLRSVEGSDLPQKR